MSRVACVYAICNTATGEAYIGLTGDLSQRWNGHRAALRHGRHYLQRLQEAWGRDGEGVFGLVILERLGVDAVAPLDPAYFRLEREWQARARFAGVQLYNLVGAPVLGVTPDVLRAALGNPARPRAPRGGAPDGDD